MYTRSHAHELSDDPWKDDTKSNYRFLRAYELREWRTEFVFDSYTTVNDGNRRKCRGNRLVRELRSIR